MRWRLRLRRHGKHGLADGTYVGTRHQTEIRYTFINFGLWAGMPLGLPFYVPGRSSDRAKRPRVGGEEPKRRTELIFYSAMERLALRSVLKPFVEDFLSSTRRAGKFRARYLMLVRMQRGIRQKLETKDAKAAVLTSDWQRLLDSMIKTAKKKRSQEMHDFTSKVFSVPKEIQQYVLTRFVRQCREKHCLAFF